MYNNSILNKYIRNYKCKCNNNFSSTSFLTPCEILNEYMNNPCSIFNKNIAPIGSMSPPPIPPLSPLPPMPPVPPMPQMPPIPPGRIIIGEGIFIGIPQIDVIGALLNDIALNEDILKGVGIAHDFGDINIMLIPNTIYEFSYRIEIRQSVVIPNSFTALLLDRQIIGTTLDSKNNVQPGVEVYMKSGNFNTDNTPNPLLQFFMENSINSQFDLISATLMLEAIQ